jgi:predicted acylesterase/phospholipase RssA
MSTSIRLSLTLSGGASLGAYQAGATAGLLRAVRHLEEDEEHSVVVDAIGGASAGSIVGLSAAYALLEGIEPTRLLHGAWVEGVSLEMLRGRDGRAPLSFERLREQVRDLLEPRDESGRPAHRLEWRQEHPISLHVALTGLGGLSYPIQALRRDSPITGATYSDWGRFDLQPGGGLDQVLEPEGRAPIDFVLASSSHPGGFAPWSLDRSDDADGYRSRGVENFPDSGTLWYTDGGLLQSQPLGRVIALAEAAARDDGDDSPRVHLLIDPRSEDPAGSGEWSDPDYNPSWQIGLARALAILPSQVLYEDLRRIEKDNSRLNWADRLVESLTPHLGKGAGDALREVIEQIDSDRAGLRADEPEVEDSRFRDEDDEPARLLRRAVDEIAGLVGEREVAVDVISPLIVVDEPGGSVTSLLAGELIGDFGGFLSAELRASDFCLGYESVVKWLPDALRRAGIDDGAADRTVAAVEDGRLFDFDETHRGSAELGDLPWRARLELARQGLQTARVLASGAVDVRRLADRFDGLGDLGRRVRAALPGGRRSRG